MKTPEAPRAEVAPSPAHQAFTELCETIGQLRPPDYSLNMFSFSLKYDPKKIMNELTTLPLADLLLADGEPYGIIDDSGYYPDIHIISGEAKIIQADMRLWKIPLMDTDSLYELYVRLWARQGGQIASQELGLAAATTSPDRVPMLSRSLGSIAYAETGYEGHGFASKRPSENEASVVISYFKSLYEVAASRQGPQAIEG